MCVCPALSDAASGVEKSQAGGGGVQDVWLHVTQPLGECRTGSPI